MKVSVWRNKTPSSTRFCRPIKITYEKETPELTQAERDSVENQIKALKNFSIPLFCKNSPKPVEIRVSFELSLTMIDGKAFNAVTGISSTRTCGICKAVPTQMNDKPTLATLVSDPNALKYGLSGLHAYIRCFECILHISYRLNIKKWQIRGANVKKCNERKKSIQEKFMKELGLLVDFPKDGGSGRSCSI